MFVDLVHSIVEKSDAGRKIMDIFEDEDIFEISDDDTHVESLFNYNPVDDYLIKRLHDIQDCITRSKDEISHVQSTSGKVLARLYNQRQFFHDHDSCDSDDDEWYDKHGQPVVKKKKNCRTPDSILTAKDVWQRVIDDKWIIGVELRNHSNRTLQEPTFYVVIQGRNELRGVTSLWQMNNRSLWNRTTNLHPENGRIAATAVLSIPNFQNTSAVIAHGTVVYHLDGKELQTPIGSIELSHSQAVDKILTPRYASNLNASILALRAATIEKIITISLHQEFCRGARLLDFFRTNDFLEVLPDVHMSKNPETFRHCIFEILSLANTRVKLRISTRSTAQLNIISLMVGEEFPDAAETAKEDKTVGEVIALERELQLKLGSDEPAQLLHARIVTDLLIP